MDDNHDQDGAARLENEEDSNEDDEEDAAHDNEEEEVENIEVEDRSTPLTAAMRDPHFQELLMNNISTGAGARDRRKSKLAQLEIDSRTPLYDAPGREPEENCDDLKFDTNSKCPLCIPPQSQNHCCDIHNVVGNQFHRHYNTKVQIQWS
jgi:hypothetical protein